MNKTRILKKFISILLIGCIFYNILPTTASADENPVIILQTGITYPTVIDALTAAKNGDTIALLMDISEDVVYTVSLEKIITIDGQGHKIMGLEIPTYDANSTALILEGYGTINLKNITLQGNKCIYQTAHSVGLQIRQGNVFVQSEGIVNVIGGPSSYSSIGLFNDGTGTINVTNAIGGSTTSELALYESMGVYNINTGTVNVSTASSGVSSGSGYAICASSSGVVNVSSAISGAAPYHSYALYCADSSTINANNSSSGLSNNPSCSWGVNNFRTGTVNVFHTDNIYCISDNDSLPPGTVNVGTASGTIEKSSVNSPANRWGTVNIDAVSTLTLKRDPNTSCVLDTITVAKNGPTNIGGLPSVCKNGVYSTKWYTDSAKTTLFTGTTVTGETTLYSEFYTVPIPTPVPTSPSTPTTPAGETDSPTSTTKISKLTLSDTSLTMLKGTTNTLKVTSLLPSNATNQNVQWKSSNSTIASVSSTGKVKAKKAGVATITCTATDGSAIKATCKITVTESSTNHIKVAWKKKAGVAGYQINLYKGSKRISRKYTAKTFYSFSKLKSGTAYKIVIKPYTKKGKTKRIGKTLATILIATRPTAPSTSLKSGSKKVYLSWKKVSGATGYELVLSTKKASGYKQFKTITKGTTVKYTKTKLTKGKTYYFKIRAYKKINGQKVYGSYSKAKNTKVK